MGHYDNCYADDAAKEHKVTEKEILDLEERVKTSDNGIHGYYDDGNDAIMKKVAESSSILVVQPVDHDGFKIQLKVDAVKKLSK